RDPAKASRGLGMVFFDNPRERPFEVHTARLEKQSVRVTTRGRRTVIAIGDLTAGSFRGEFQFTLYPRSPLVHAEAVVETDEEFRAILYDAGLSGASPDWRSIAWLDPHGHLRRMKVTPGMPARPVGVKFRTLVAESGSGSLAVFPAPHQYFPPLDFADNFEFAWLGNRDGESPDAFGFGIRQPPEGDRRWVPWFDAPPGTRQRLGVFYLLSGGDAEAAIAETARYTRVDRFKELPGHVTFSSHYHVEHTVDYLERQKKQETSGIPKGLEAPGFVTKFKQTGIDIIHLAEFHFGWTPGQKTEDRLPMLKTMHEECARLSDDEILILPGEEPNVHLGGHWISFFPKPVYWVLNRGEDEPFVEEIEGYGTVYRVGSPDDVLELMERENGLMWTAHPRIKSSLAYPDGYRDTEFYQSDHFLGAAWKAMPADLSRPRIGWRVLDLLDDMNQWGGRKQIVGEVDVFRVEPDYELYAHMNVNYLRMDRVPSFEEGWQPVLDAVRGGHYFVSTGEILIPRFAVGGSESGETLSLEGGGPVPLEAELEWTFPLAFAELISGDGNEVFRERIDLGDTTEFGTRALRMPVELDGRIWARLEVWDIAANGAFTQPVWIELGAGDAVKP
ncbi:MAG TPA: hypothetical protein VMS21_01620, partial [Methylomirabilota bacterium]|nr:hypothetical protein [Methylomirabilota bacterium]